MTRILLVSTGLVLMAWGCAARTVGDGSVCEPGSVQECPCGGGQMKGTQVCADGGTSWGECDCGTSDVDADGDTHAELDTDSCSEPCVANSFRCDGNAREQCDSTGCEWRVVENCACGCSGGSCTGCCSGGICPFAGLEWQEEPTADRMSWIAAQSHCQLLDLDGRGWRLASIDELRSLIRGCAETQTGGSCNIGVGSCLSTSCRDESPCYGCSSGAGPASGCYWPSELKELEGNCSYFWSSSLVEDAVGDADDYAWAVGFGDGRVDYAESPLYEYHVRCVR